MSDSDSRPGKRRLFGTASATPSLWAFVLAAAAVALLLSGGGSGVHAAPSQATGVITCDNWFTLFYDGSQIAVTNQQWQNGVAVSVAAADYDGVFSGIFFNFDVGPASFIFEVAWKGVTYRSSPANWKCTNVKQTDPVPASWQLKATLATATATWPQAVSYGYYPTAPWGTAGAGFTSSDQWIWTTCPSAGSCPGGTTGGTGTHGWVFCVFQLPTSRTTTLTLTLTLTR